MKADAKPTTNAAKLLAAIRALGVDKYLQPLSINTKALAKKTGIASASIQASLEAAVKRGDVVVCKVTPATGHSYNEWRAGPGVPPADFKPLNTKRPGVALRTPARANALAAPLSTPKPGVNEIEPATLGKPQPAVGSNTGSTRSAPPIAAERAVTAKQATPAPAAHVALKKEPTAPKVPAGDALTKACSNCSQTTAAGWAISCSARKASGTFEFTGLRGFSRRSGGMMGWAATNDSGMNRKDCDGQQDDGGFGDWHGDAGRGDLLSGGLHDEQAAACGRSH